MNQRNDQQKQYAPEKEFRNIDDTYVLDVRSGLYQPKPNASQNQSDHGSAGSRQDSPLFVDARTNWWPIIVATLVNLLTLFVIAYYTYVTQGIYEASQVGAVGTIQASVAARDSADIAKATMQIDQRAWIVPSAGTIQPERERPILQQLLLTNTGKTAATDMHAVFRLEIVKVGNLPTFTYPPPISSGSDVPVMFPNSSIPSMPLKIPISKVLPNKKIEPIKWDDDLIESYNKREFLFVLHGKISFLDVFKIKHQQTFCQPTMHFDIGLIPVPPKAVERCGHYNNIEK